jgi:hypothetical protein
MLTVPQGLFDVLPEKLKERRSSLNFTPSGGRKRAQPGADAGTPQERPTPPDLTPTLVTKEHAAAPARARTLPSDYLAKLAKRNSLPDPVLAGLPEHMQNPHMLAFTSPTTSSPMSPGYPWTPQTGNARIPDLKNVMFPSNDPFAYPNHPTSALENSEGHFSLSESSIATPNESNMFGTPPTTNAQQMPQYGGYDFGFPPALNDNPNLMHQQFGTSGSQDFNAPFADVMMHNAMGGEMHPLSGLPNNSEPISTNNATVAGNQDEFWRGVNGEQNDILSSLPTGHQNIDYFAHDGWNPAWQEQHYTDAR